MSNYYKRRGNCSKSKCAINNCDDCVCYEVKQIIEAQEQVRNDCSLSCDNSIQQLKGNNKEAAINHTTIPFMLYCGGTCEPFIGNGVFEAPCENKWGNFFGCVETPIFRAKHFVKNKDCCVKLELLLPLTEDCCIKQPPEEISNVVCSFFPGDDPVTCFQATGICLTVDLKHFVGINCLSPITPLPANEFLDTVTSPPKPY